MLGSSKMIGLIPLIIILIIKVHFMEKTSADSKHNQHSGQKVVLKKEENHPVVYYSRGCLPTESRFFTKMPCKPDNNEEYAKHGVDPNKTKHEECSTFKGMTPTCRYNYEKDINFLPGFICCLPTRTKGIRYTMMFNKKAAYIMGNILLKTTLFTDFGEQQRKEAEHTFLPLFRNLRDFVEYKTKLDKKSIPNFELNQFFKFLSEKNDGHKFVPQDGIYKIMDEEKEKSDAEIIFGFNKVLGTNMENELNKLCEHYKKADAKHTDEYDKICEKVANFINGEFFSANYQWRWNRDELLKIFEKPKTKLGNTDGKKFVKQLVKEYNKDAKRMNYFAFPKDQSSFDFRDLRKIITFGEARKLYRQIWIRALDYALMSIDVCYFPNRMKFWEENVRKASKLDTYRDGMSDAEYLIYFLLEMIKQIDPKYKFNKRSKYREPFQVVLIKDEVKLIDATLPKGREYEGIILSETWSLFCI